LFQNNFLLKLKTKKLSFGRIEYETLSQANTIMTNQVSWSYFYVIYSFMTRQRFF